MAVVKLKLKAGEKNGSLGGIVHLPDRVVRDVMVGDDETCDDDEEDGGGGGGGGVTKAWRA